MNFRSNKWINMAPRNGARDYDDLANYEIPQPEAKANTSFNNDAFWNNFAAVSVWILCYVIAFLFYTPLEETNLYCYYYLMLCALVIGACFITRDVLKLIGVAMLASAHPFIGSWLRNQH